MQSTILPLLAVSFAQVAPAQSPTPANSVAEAKPHWITTEHSVEIAGQRIDYDATVGWLILDDDEGAPHARFGYTAYTKKDVEDAAQRPVMFAFNGGPGSSSIWLHMGILGPQRIVVTDEGFSPPPPARRVANEYSVLDLTDIVMVDPVGTGFSRPLGDTKGSVFWGVDQDIASVGAFVKQYVTENERWASPKYILGESYGGIRSAGLVWHMQNVHGMNFNGVVVVSPFMNMGSGMDGAGIDLPHVLYLSTLAATAWYHDKLEERPDSLVPFLDEVERFAMAEYAPALLQGYGIDAEHKQRIAGQLARYTGTDAEYWLRADLRVSHQQFVQELLRDERQIAGRIDSRFVGPSVNPLAESMDYDPFFPSVGPAFTAGFLDYLQRDLDFSPDETYRVSAFGEVGASWDWSHDPPSGGGWATPWADLRPDLARALTANPGLHLLVQQGYYDLATPVHATKYDVQHLDVPPEARERIHMAFYEAGHMMYLHEPSMKKYREDLAGFIRLTDRLE